MEMGHFHQSNSNEVRMLAYAEKRKPPIPPEAALFSRRVDVLAVYDEDLLGQFLNNHLSKAGYHVRVARNTVAASARILEAAPDVMIMDLDSRGIKCFEFLSGIRAEGAIPFFPVIYLTADMNAAGHAHELGGACVRKPIQARKLLATVAFSSLIRRPPSPPQYRLSH
jgi:DNA-binding response OmpR family regulator